MSRSANPIAVGAFVLGALLLAFLMLLFFSGANWWSERERFTLLYDTSVKGLNVGAPVTIKGVKIGQVTDITANLYGDELGVINEVTIEIDPGALKRSGKGDTVSMQELIERGLRVQLKLQSMLTAMLYVDVDFQPDKPAQYKRVKTRYPQLPTTPTNLEQLTRDLESIDVNRIATNLQNAVNGINAIVNDPSTQQLAKNIGAAVADMQAAAVSVRTAANGFDQKFGPMADNANTLMIGLNRDLPQLVQKLDAAVAQLDQASQSVNRTAANAAFLTSDDSPTLYRINTAASSINQAADQLRHLTDLLERRPEALLLGKQEE
jgi:paraquat-inducible protein B